MKDGKIQIKLQIYSQLIPKSLLGAPCGHRELVTVAAGSAGGWMALSLIPSCSSLTTQRWLRALGLHLPRWKVQTQEHGIGVFKLRPRQAPPVGTQHTSHPPEKTGFPPPTHLPPAQHLFTCCCSLSQNAFLFLQDTPWRLHHALLHPPESNQEPAGDTSGGWGKSCPTLLSGRSLELPQHPHLPPCDRQGLRGTLTRTPHPLWAQPCSWRTAA